MRKDRRWRGGSPGGLAIGLVFILSVLAVGLNATASASVGASPSPTAIASADSSAVPTASETPTAAPSASAGFDCRTAFANVEDFEVLRGATVWVQIRSFPANAPTTVSFVSMVDEFERPIGAATTDEHGNSDIAVVVPTDAPFGDAFLRVTGTEACMSEAYIIVVPSLEAISIDDDTVVPGQRLTIWASGFAPGANVALFLDGDARDALCRCRQLAEARTSADGSVVMVIRFPRDVSVGAHFLTVNGSSFDQMHDLGLVVDITVGGVSIMPPTDTD